MAAGTQAEFYRARVEEARADAASATLDHVRERCLRSEEAWMQLANRASRAEAARTRLAAEKAAASLP